MRVRWIRPIAAAVLLALPAAARANLILDGGFETQQAQPGAYLQVTGGNTLGGAWTVLGNDILNIDKGYTEGNRTPPVTFNAHGGSDAVDLTGAGNTGLADGISQAVSTVAGQEYVLSFFVGRASGDPTYLTPSTVNLRIDGGTPTSFTNSNATPGGINWQQFVTVFVANATTTTIAFLNGTTSNNYAGLDDVDLVAAPEPSTLISGGIAGLAGVGYGWRRRRKAAGA